MTELSKIYSVSELAGIYILCGVYIAAMFTITWVYFFARHNLLQKDENNFASTGTWIVTFCIACAVSAVVCMLLIATLGGTIP
jgi:hypothetical protein